MIIPGFRTNQTFTVRPSRTLLTGLFLATFTFALFAATTSWALRASVQGWLGLVVCLYLVVIAVQLGWYLTVLPGAGDQRTSALCRFLPRICALPQCLIKVATFRFAEDHWQLLTGVVRSAGVIADRPVKRAITRSGPALVLPWLVVVPFVENDELRPCSKWRTILHWCRAPVVLVATRGSCDVDTLRRLRVLLRWHAAA